MKKISLLCVFLLCLCSSAISENNDDAQIRNKLLDANHLTEAKAQIDKCVIENRDDLIVVAMHNQDYRMRSYCLTQIEKMQKVAQSRIISSLLVDNEIISYGDEMIIGGLSVALQQRMHQTLVSLASNLLGRKVDCNGLLTRADARRLANELKMIR